MDRNLANYPSKANSSPPRRKTTSSCAEAQEIVSRDPCNAMQLPGDHFTRLYTLAVKRDRAGISSGSSREEALGEKAEPTKLTQERREHLALQAFLTSLGNRLDKSVDTLVRVGLVLLEPSWQLEFEEDGLDSGFALGVLLAVVLLLVFE